MNPTEVMTIDRENTGGELMLSRPATATIYEAQMAAKPWGAAVEKLGLFKIIGPSKHLYIEAWQMLGAIYRCSARIVTTNYIQMGDVHGFEARAELYHMPTGQVISMADAMCLNDEENWGPRTKYKDNWVTDEVTGKRKNDRLPDGFVGTPLQQLRSMAQTRAMSKVYSNSFKWVARLQGYQGTPAEEMTGNEGPDPQTKGTSTPGRKSAANGTPDAPPTSTTQQPAGNGADRAITEKQAGRMYAIAMGKGLNNASYAAFLKSFGFAESRLVTVSRYDEMVTALEAGGGTQA